MKFRGLHPDQDGDYWVYGLPHEDLPNSTGYYDKCKYRIAWHLGNTGTSNAPIYTETLTQFTGLLDKNGKEIYEGDVMRFDDGYINIIEWDNEWCGWLPWVGNIEGYDRITRYNGEVIGNIYENQELIKK